MKKITIILLMAFGLSACTKYDEGPKISFRNPEKLITGRWDVSKYEINSIDSTEYYLEHRACQIVIYKDHYDYGFYLQNCKDVTNVDSPMFGLIIIDKKKNYINFIGANYPNYWPVFNSIVSIKRLTKSELFIEADIDQNHYRLELIKG